MRNIVILLTSSAFALSPVLAQTTTPPAATTTTTTTAPAATTPASPDTAAPTGAATTTTTAAAPAATSTEIAVGDTVNDPQGGKVGTVTATSGDLVTVATANAKAQLPKKAFARSDTGLVIGMTAAQLEAAAKAAGGARGAGN